MAPLLSSGSRVPIALIRVYRHLISSLSGPHCHLTPTCPGCGVKALRRFEVMKGSWLTAKRVLKCHLPHPDGGGPVPPEPSDTEKRWRWICNAIF